MQDELLREGARMSLACSRARALVPLIAAATILASCGSQEPPRSVSRSGAHSDARWSKLPPAPVRLSAFTQAVWIGDRMLMWDRDVWISYSPSAGTWGTIAEPPKGLRGTVGANLTWTGRELVVWGGSESERDDAGPSNSAWVFTPSENSWRPAAASPLGGGELFTAAWDGEEVLYWGCLSDTDSGCLNDRGHWEAAAYDPSADKWRRLPVGPLGGRGVATSAWTGRELIVWIRTPTPHRRGNAPTLREGGIGAALDPRTGKWSMLPPAPLSPRRFEATAWTGSVFVVLGGQALRGDSWGDYRSDGATYDPDAHAWRRMRDAPVRSPNVIAANGRLVVWGGVEGVDEEGIEIPSVVGAVYDPIADTWRELPRPPIAARFGPLMKWSGSEVLVWGGCCESDEVYFNDGAALHL